MRAEGDRRRRQGREAVDERETEFQLRKRCGGKGGAGEGGWKRKRLGIFWPEVPSALAIPPKGDGEKKNKKSQIIVEEMKNTAPTRGPQKETGRMPAGPP